MFINKYYRQVNGIAMVSPLGPANILCVVLKAEDFKNCCNDFKPVFHGRYVDDIFGLFS